jgi:hypothetical protein
MVSAEVDKPLNSFNAIKRRIDAAIATVRAAPNLARSQAGRRIHT